MEELGSEVVYPTLEQIIDVNRRMIQAFGGSFVPPTNVRNRSSLEYILTAISQPIFGQHLFDSLKEKAAALGFEIIVSHIFFDGNKRTAIHIVWEFLASNHVPLVLDRSVEDLAVGIAQGDVTRGQFLAWIHAHQ